MKKILDLELGHCTDCVIHRQILSLVDRESLKYTCPDDRPIKVMANSYPGINRARLIDMGENNTVESEVCFAANWQRHSKSNLEEMLGGKPSPRDEEVAATVIQWLGTCEGVALIIESIGHSEFISGIVMKHLALFKASRALED